VGALAGLLIYTLSERRVPNTGVRNAASRDVFASNSVAFSGQVTTGDEIIFKIRDQEYKYKVVAGDTIATIIEHLTDSINAGNGNPDVIAFLNPTFTVITLTARKGGIEGFRKMIAGVKAEAAAVGREIEVFTVGQVVCRPTQKEAEDYYRYAIIEQADWGTVDGMLQIKNITPATVGEEEYKKKREYFASRAIGGYPFVGTPDHVAEELAMLSRGGIRGIGFSMINYLDELPFFRDEVLPRLAKMGVRAH